MTISQISDIPKLIELDDTTKDVVLGSLKLVLKRLKNKELIAAEIEYRDLLNDPNRMHEFIACFKKNLKVGRDLALNQQGQPVKDYSEQLVCGMSLAQIERLLVYTCAKKIYRKKAAEEDRQKTAKPKDAKKGWLRGGKQAGKQAAKKTTSEVPDEIKAIIAFDWQLPMLETYVFRLRHGHLMELGDGVLAIKSPEALEVVAATDPVSLKEAKKAAGERFLEMLEANAAAVLGLVRCDKKKLAMISQFAGRRVWDVFAGDPELLVEILGCERYILKALGPSVADLGVESFHTLEDISETVLEPLLEAFREVFGERGKVLLNDPDFVGKHLRKIARDFRSMSAKTEDEMQSIKNSAVIVLQTIRQDIAAGR